jgi:hypothetical protein
VRLLHTHTEIPSLKCTEMYIVLNINLCCNIFTKNKFLVLKQYEIKQLHCLCKTQNVPKKIDEILSEFIKHLMYEYSV